MTEPSLKRLRLGFEQDNVQDLIRITRDFITNWDLFRLLASKLSLEELNRLCSLNRNFRERCKSDPIIQRMKTKMIVQRKVQQIPTKVGYNTDQEQFVFEVTFTDRNGHNINIVGNVFINDDYYTLNSLGLRMRYDPNPTRFDTTDFNIYKEIMSMVESVESKYSIDLQPLYISDPDYGDPGLVVYITNNSIREALPVFEEMVNWFVDVKQMTIKMSEQGINCSVCSNPAKFKSSETGELFCSQKCAK